MKLIRQTSLEVKKSRFISYLYEIENKEQVKEILEQLQKEHKKARHIPYAYLFNNTAGKSDDKEPSNTSGTPILSVLQRKNLINHALFVVRYFGGTKLGAGLLMRTYLNAALQVTTNPNP